MLSTLFFDIRLAFRSLLRQRAFTAVVVGTLALGIGANTAMFSVVHASLLEPLPYLQPERLVLAQRTVSGHTAGLLSTPAYYDYEAQTPGFESLAATRQATSQATVTGGSRAEHVLLLQTSFNLFSTLGVHPVAGRWFRSDEDRAGGDPVVMVGEGFANRRFGSPAAAVGQKVAVSHTRTAVAATIVGVMPASFRFLGRADVYAPMLRGENDGPTFRASHDWMLVARLKPGVSLNEAQRQVDVVAARLRQAYPKTDKNDAVRLDQLQDAIVGGHEPILLILMAAVGLVLLIACANVAGLLIARDLSRRSELAVRQALGASRARVAAQMITETVLFAALAGAAGLVLATWLQRLLPTAAGLADSAIGAVRLQAPVLLFALGASLVTGLLSGGVPVLRACSPQPAANLAPGTRVTESKGGARLRSLLVVAQVALSLVLLVGVGLLLRSVVRLASNDLGFRSDGLLVAALDQPYRETIPQIQFQNRLYEDVVALPGVVSVSMTSQVPLLQPGSNPPAWAAKRPPRDASEELTTLRRIVTPGYFKTMGIPLRAGRDLTAGDREGEPLVTVIDEVMARRFFPGENPLGQRVVVTYVSMADTSPKEFEVVGVVGNARLNALGRAPMATCYMSSYQFPMGRVNLVLRSRVGAAALERALTQIAARAHPDLAVDPLVGMNEIVDRALVSPRVMTATLAGFSTIALLLAALGLYGVLTFYVAQRGHEIGVRMALGASAGAVLRQVLSRSALMVVPGLAIGLAASLASGRLLKRVLYETPPTDPVTYVGVILTLAVVATAASAWPAMRAARVNPVVALRGE